MAIDVQTARPLGGVPHRHSASQPRPRRIAIVGGGFSGVAVLAHLIAKAPAGSLEIELFESGAELATGAAYATRETAHLLNMQAGKMGALAGVPEDFYLWLMSESGRRSAAQFWPGHSIGATDYVPRILYGRYLKDLLARLLRKARQQGNRMRITRSRVSDIALRRNGAVLEISADERRSQFDAVILATGALAPRSHPTLSKSARRAHRYIADVWKDDDALARRVGDMSPEKSILILGTGLTAVDAILTLRARGFAGRIVAVSRHGRLPLTHVAGARRSWAFSVAPETVTPKASAIVAWLKREARLSEAAGVGWRSVLDTLRPRSEELWRSLDKAVRQRIVKSISLWSIHRHRMAPAVCAEIEALRRSGALEIHAARIRSIERRLGGFTVRWSRENEMRPALVINCMGAESDIAAVDDPFLKSLVRRRMIVSSPLGGIKMRENAAVEGENGGRLFAVGPIAGGELFESISVPELRDLAAEAADLALARLRVSVPATPRPSPARAI
jgi:uncharacterized NAD(P)/FAD-binding protein YdhS